MHQDTCYEHSQLLSLKKIHMSCQNNHKQMTDVQTLDSDILTILNSEITVTFT